MPSQSKRELKRLGMTSPTQQISCYLDPKFDAVIEFAVIEFEMCDGFESGLAVFATGEGIQFSSCTSFLYVVAFGGSEAYAA
jgi:hypothetical protein